MTHPVKRSFEPTPSRVNYPHRSGSCRRGKLGEMLIREPVLEVEPSLLAAIGRLSVNFNWLEQIVEMLLERVAAPESTGLVQILYVEQAFRRKVDLLMNVLNRLPDFAVPSSTGQWSLFIEGLRPLLIEARNLTSRRNKVIHWHPQQEDSKITESEVLEAAAEVQKLALQLVVVSLSFDKLLAEGLDAE
ncbi:MAG: hypothetical protein R2729_03000 [Bryobacteraceae bacterium]